MEVKQIIGGIRLRNIYTKEALQMEYPEDFSLYNLDGCIKDDKYYIVEQIHPVTPSLKRVVISEIKFNGEIGQEVEKSNKDILEHFCKECGSVHAPNQPHNRESEIYQYRFSMKHGRLPSWEDAMSHCSTDVMAFWRAILVLNEIPLKVVEVKL